MVAQPDRKNSAATKNTPMGSALVKIILYPWGEILSTYIKRVVISIFFSLRLDYQLHSKLLIFIVIVTV
jgi:hypothetical protein